MPGNSIPLDGPSGLYLSYSRFYISGEQLFCRGPGSDSAQALVENIHDMKIWYGVATGTGADLHRVAYYSRAGNNGEMNPADFDRVVSARICLVAKSENEVMDGVTSYVDCEGNSTTPLDRRMYRAFTSTIVLQNRMGTN